MDLGVLTSITALLVSVFALIISTVLTRRQLSSAKAATTSVVIIEMITREQRSDAFRESYDYIVHRLEKEHRPTEGVDALPKEAREHVYRVALYFASLGHLVVFGAVDERIVLSIVNYSLRRTWGVLAPYIRAEREMREREMSTSNFMVFFEHVAYRATQFNQPQLQQDLRLSRFEVSSSSGVGSPSPDAAPTSERTAGG